MVENLYQRSFAVNRHRATLCGPHLDAYLGRLRGQGYRVTSLRRHLGLITRFGEYLQCRRVTRLCDVDQRLLARFMAFEKLRLKGCRYRAQLLTKARSVIAAFLAQAGVGARGSVEESPSVLTGYCHWLLADRGLQPNSIGLYRGVLKQFVAHLGSDSLLDTIEALFK